MCFLANDEIILTVIDEIYNRGVNRAEISGPARPANIFFRPGPARPAINILQNLYKGLKKIFGGWQKLFVKYGYNL